MSMMPEDPDSRLEQPATEAATVPPGLAPDGPQVAAESGQPLGDKPAAGDQPQRRRRRRRRRRRPRPDGAEAT